MKIKPPRILFYDIETTLLLAHTFSLGKQVVRHNQLLGGYFSRTHIICIQYKWSDQRSAHVLDWGKSVEDEKQMIIKFNKLVEEADVVIGKNSDRFDNKHIMTQHLWFELEGMSNFIEKVDDLEKQLRKFFYLSSYSLDYLSKQLGFGGKDKMSYEDWEAINYYRTVQCCKLTNKSDKILKFLTGKSYETIVREGAKALKKMYKYGKKDVLDTDRGWKKVLPYIQPKFNMAAYYNENRCVRCGSKNIIKNGTRIVGQTRYQVFRCLDNKEVAGKAPILKDGSLGKIRR